MFRSIKSGLQMPRVARMLSTDATQGNAQRIFGGTSQGSSKNDYVFQKLDKLEKSRGGFGSNFNTFMDGMDYKLEKAAESFNEEEFSFRDDIVLTEDMGWTTYEPEDLDLRKPAKQPYVARKEFVTSTKEVLQRADFRNVRFLANFITDAGIIIKRSQTDISAKAQRKVAREIKTARAFGLMPFTTMGTKSFVVGKSMEDGEEDFVFQNYYSNDQVDQK